MRGQSWVGLLSFTESMTNHIFRILLLTAISLIVSCASSKSLPTDLRKAVDDCLAVERQETIRFQSSQALESEKYILEISRMTGRQRTSDSGFKLARLIQASTMTHAEVRELLLKNSKEYGLQNWMFAVLQMFDGIATDDIRVAAKEGGAPPSPFIPAP